MIKKILQLIDNYWKFDNDQQPSSSWHDKQDLLTEVEQLKNCNISDVSHSFIIGDRKENGFCDITINGKKVGELYTFTEDDLVGLKEIADQIYSHQNCG